MHARQPQSDSHHRHVDRAQWCSADHVPRHSRRARTRHPRDRRWHSQPWTWRVDHVDGQRSDRGLSRDRVPPGRAALGRMERPLVEHRAAGIRACSPGPRAGPSGLEWVRRSAQPEPSCSRAPRPPVDSTSSPASTGSEPSRSPSPTKAAAGTLASGVAVHLYAGTPDLVNHSNRVGTAMWDSLPAGAVASGTLGMLDAGNSWARLHWQTPWETRSARATSTSRFRCAVPPLRRSRPARGPPGLPATRRATRLRPATPRRALSRRRPQHVNG